MEETKLVEVVQSHSCLYDTTLKEYRNQTLKEAAWMTISKTLGASPTECQSRWRELRDKYNREIKKGKVLKSGSGTADVYKSKWALLPAMGFLAPHMKSRPTTSNFNCSTSANETMEGALEGSISQLNNNYSPVSSEEPSPKKMKPTVPKTLPKPSKIEDQLLQIIKGEEKEDDEEKLFCASLAPALKRLDPRKRNKAKIEILSVIDKYEYEDYPRASTAASSSYLQQLYIVPSSASGDNSSLHSTNQQFVYLPNNQ